MRLYGKSWTRRELEARVGRIEQIGGLRRTRATEGPEAGVEVIQVRTGAGLCYEIVPSKGLDISLAEVHGKPISWQSPNGDAHASFYDKAGSEWLRTASGGLLMTCGLMNAGAPCEDEGEQLGMHGRIHHTPAREVAAVTRWEGDELEMTVSGTVDESSIFGGHLRLYRHIRSRLGENEIVIRDEVRNMGFQRCPHMMLYHVNFGFPLMSEETKVHFADGQVQARESTTPLEQYEVWQAPDPDYLERVYYHEKLGKPEIIIDNPSFLSGGTDAATTPLQALLTWSADTLPVLVQWKMPGAGTHVLGLEPANCRAGGRREARERGELVYLEPGQSVFYQVKLSIR